MKKLTFDLGEKIKFPEKLYGRERETERLKKAFKEISNGNSRLILLSGVSGSGKTVLGRELKNTVTTKNGFYLEGKFNQFQREVPHFALRQALQKLISEILATSISEQEVWKNKILKSVGKLGKLLTDIIPDLDKLIGKQPGIPEISPYEAPHRFISVLKQFLSIFCHAEHPLVLFIDDWQWADSFSLNVLKQLQNDLSLRYLLIIAAYRNDEVDQHHPFQLAINELKLNTFLVQTIDVNNLSENTVKQFLIDAFEPSIDNLTALTEYIHQTTSGNPFFVLSLVEALYHKKIIKFDSKLSTWNWNRNSSLIEKNDVVHLFQTNLKSLAPESQELISLSACIGNRFSLKLLSLVSGRSNNDISRLIKPAINLGLLSSIDKNELQFRHDKVQQAAHGLIADELIPILRLKIGQLLEQHLDPDEKDKLLLEITDHYNAGQILLVKPADIIKLIKLNIISGSKARAATAYYSALQFQRVAASHLENKEISAQFWRENQEQGIILYREMAETEFLEGDKKQAEKCIQIAVEHARTAIERAEVLCTKILHNTLLAQYNEAISSGREALKALDINLAENNYDAARDLEIDKTIDIYNTKNIAELKKSAPMQHEKFLMAIQVLITLGPPCYRAHQPLWSVIVPMVVRLTLQHGSVPQVGYSHTAFGGLLGWVSNDYNKAKVFYEVADSLMHSEFNNPANLSVYYLMVGSSSRHWFKHYRYASQDYTQAIESGIQSGNLQYAAYAFAHNMYCQFFQGLPLSKLIEETENSLIFSQSRTNQWASDLLESGILVFSDLAGQKKISNDQHLKFINTLEQHSNLQVKAIYLIFRELCLFLKGQVKSALLVSDNVEDLIYTVGTQGLIPWPEHKFIRFILLTEIYDDQTGQEKSSLLTQFKSTIEQLQIWQKHAPENYTFRVLTARAIIASIENDVQLSLSLFDQAIDSAKSSGFIQWQGILNEMASRLAHQNKLSLLAQIYWQNAYFCYYEWGALSKVKQLEQQLKDFSILSNQEMLSNQELSPQITNYIHSLNTQAINKIELQQQSKKSEILHELSQATDTLREEVAERKRIEKELTLAASVFKHSQEGIMITDSHVRIIDVNHAFTLITGYTREEVLGKNPNILSSDRQDKTFYQAVWQSLSEQGFWQGEIWNKNKNGDIYPELLTINVVLDQYGKPQNYVALFSDITEIKEHQHQLEVNAYYDPLTGLSNRAHFTTSLRQSMNQALRQRKRIMIVFLDMDGFKSVNDQYGHDVGDQVLMKLAGLMKEVLRDSDTLARLGGDEFVAVFHECNEEQVIHQLFNRLLKALSATINIDDLLIQLSASVGATFYPQEEEVDAEQLMRQADQAMYKAKLMGKNCYHLFDEIQDRTLRGHHEAIEQIDWGLSSDEFILYYQPKVNMHSGEVLGFEALVRWQHPEHGFLLPDRFLPTIETHPLIVKLGEKTIELALKKLSEWRNKNIKKHISVNISAFHLQQKDFIPRLNKLLNLFPDVEAKYLELEILETSALQNIDHVLQIIKTCSDMGISFSLDDFGTGYSSLTYLKLLPIKTLKIDRSFVQDMLHDPDDLNILQGVIGLANSFNREVIAEGVETIEHGELLIWLGCELAQGYGVSRPMREADIEQWLTDWEPSEYWLKSRSIQNYHLPILTSIIKHRGWISDIKDCLHNNAKPPPIMDIHQCKFGQWLDSVSHQIDSTTYNSIKTMHIEIHDIANQLLLIKNQESKENALKKLPDLYDACNSLLNILRTIISSDI
ncbi:MAG: EAL domain-containing protein [Gammaproteobacteria bacterium]|nr:EAL domain-containing protein [Gammaproteobacteria bacterium]